MARGRRESFLVFGSPAIEQAEIDEVVDTLRSGWIGTGPRVARFEQAFAAYKGAGDAVALSSCTAALHVAMLVCGIGPGDEVVTTPMTFAATANAIVHTGARPVFVDCDREAMTIDPERVAAALTPRTRAILPVHFAGRPCAMGPLLDLARLHGLRLVEDCAHAIETRWNGTPAGLIGDVGCFSFYVTKNVAAAEGGMLLTREPELAARAKTLSLHGLTADAWSRFADQAHRHYQVVEPGFKYNLTDVHAAIALHQLARVEANHARRAAIWARYQAAFAGLPVRRPLEPERGTVHGCHLYTLLVDDAAPRSRDDVLAALAEWKIGAGVHYTALHTHPYYARALGHEPGDFPNALEIGERTFSIPLSPKLTDEDVEDVVAAVCDALS